MTQPVLAAGVREKKEKVKRNLENKEYDCTAETKTQSAMYVPLVGVGDVCAVSRCWRCMCR
jgi:hypothetical protein